MFALDDPNDIDVFFVLEKGSEFVEVVHELWDQDAVLTKDGELALVQFKYSLSEIPIDRGELQEIIHKFDKGAGLATSNSSKVIACILVTNRELTSRGGAAERLWTEEEKKQRGYKLIRCKSSMESEIANLDSFARKLGASDSEVERGIERLIGRVHMYSVERPWGATLTIADIREAIVSNREAKLLTAEEVAKYTKPKIEDDVNRLSLVGPAVRRDILSSLSQLCNEHALLVLYGQGGCGKTVSLWQWVKERGELIVFSSAQEVNRSWLATEICNWAGHSPVHPWRSISLEEVVYRIQSANGERQLPIMYVALDGLDEGEFTFDQETTIREIIRWFWDEDKIAKAQPPRAVLVVTCRNLDDFVRKWLRFDLSGHDSGPEPESITVGSFTDGELIAALAFSELEPRTRDAIKQALELPERGEIDYGLLSTSYTSVPETVDQTVIKALHYPTIWRSFLELDTQTQNNLLGSDFSALYALAERVISRFCEKAIRRNVKVGLRQSDLLDSLSNVVKFHRDDGSQWRNLSDWRNPLIQSGFFSEAEATRLYREAFSSGIIVDDHLKWQWSFNWLSQYLASR